MDLRTRITDALKDAMRAKEAARLSTLRLVQAAIKDRDIAARGEGQPSPVADVDVTAVLAKMVKSRADSVAAYVAAGREDLADKERAEIAVIEGFLPRQLDGAEMEQAVADAIAATGAASIRDMGRVMAALREAHAGAMDMGKAGALVKARLSA